MKYLSIGHEVTVNIPLSERTTHKEVAKYQGQKMKIADRKSYRHGTQVYYELVGAESEYGIPYGFAREWLVGE